MSIVRMRIVSMDYNMKPYNGNVRHTLNVYWPYGLLYIDDFMLSSVVSYRCGEIP